MFSGELKDNIETWNALASSPALTPHNIRYKNIWKPEAMVKYWPAYKVYSKLMFILFKTINLILQKDSYCWMNLGFSQSIRTYKTEIMDVIEHLSIL